MTNYNLSAIGNYVIAIINHIHFLRENEYEVLLDKISFSVHWDIILSCHDFICLDNLVWPSGESRN